MSLQLAVCSCLLYLGYRNMVTAMQTTLTGKDRTRYECDSQ
ncbi:MAG: hypothetical protein ACK45I_00970 [Bacteroidota bacterium]